MLVILNIKHYKLKDTIITHNTIPQSYDSVQAILENAKVIEEATYNDAELWQIKL